MYNVGPHSIAEWKVVWSGQVALSLDAAVTGPDHATRSILTDQTAYQVPFTNALEAFYFCAIMNSLPIRAFYRFVAYKHTSMNFFQGIDIPQFVEDEPKHMKFSELARQCHEEVGSGNPDALRKIEREIDELAAQLWSITYAELEAIRDALSDD